ncbi:hypothetical protein AGABI1DRAFT_82788 [Agaricus bisporus var. burnettii JB137-S8]|uniref:Uncharacterized protein n=1 Tax=Agaricus bisporus var. burnettii (strain JB137-S8 / ATCC MYA-4627 / FGSC 10392) TaxID=597362 RepID=K5Y4Z0_AGABU|nr:uncharacterized protein AGABI1DRAFT_82788 [Agaricus bisporus var. burnettii JB137-S8]EKM83110.1 hypothetical protein AGABI1DRAFT_82788 [Agaricus bisporus var. burnettii JB137-S8]
MCIEYRNKSLSPTQSLTPLNASTPSAIDTIAALRLLVAIGTMEPAQPAAFTL